MDYFKCVSWDYNFKTKILVKYQSSAIRESICFVNQDVKSIIATNDSLSVHNYVILQFHMYVY